MRFTEQPYDELPANLEGMLRSGWAFLIADDNVIQAVEMKIDPEGFTVIMIPGAGLKPMTKVLILVKVAALLDETVPDREKIRALWCEWKMNPASGTMDLGVMSVAFEDEEVTALVERMLEE